MKTKNFKKFLTGLCLGAVLMFGTAAAASAEEKALTVSTQEAETFELEDHTDSISAARLDYPTNTVQTKATTTSISLKWNSVKEADGYQISIAPFASRNDSAKYKPLGTSKGTSITISKLKPGTAYTVRILAKKGNTSAKYAVLRDCTTLYQTAAIKNVSNVSNLFTFYMKTPNPRNSITGYRVTYTNLATNKTTTRYYENPLSFSSQPAANTFHKLVIRPYITLNGKKFYDTAGGTTQYIAQQPKLYKRAYSSSTMTIGWNPVAGSTSYTIYMQAPGSGTYKKVKTTGALSYKFTGLKQNANYKVKVVANKGGYHSPNNNYYVMNISKK